MEPSELAYLGNCTTMVESIAGTGVVDVGALETAFAALRTEHPMLGAKIERVAEGYVFVLPVDPDPPLIRVVHAPTDEISVGRDAVVDLEVGLSAVELRVEPGRFRLSLLVYHGIYDGNAVVRLLFSGLLEHYAQAVVTGEVVLDTPRPMLESYESIVGKRRVVRDSSASGLEDALRAAPFLPVEEAASAERPRQVRVRFTQEETERLRLIGKARGLSMSAVVTGIVVAAMHEFVGSPEELVVPLLSVVAIRDRLDPPVPITEGTVMLGTAGDVVVVTPQSDPLDLGRQVIDRIDQELSDGTIQESHLHMPRLLSELLTPPQELGAASKFIVGISNVGRVLEYPDPPGLVIEDFRGMSANLSALDLGKPDAGVATWHNYWFMALTYDGQLSLDFKVRDAGSLPDDELPLVSALRGAAERIAAEAATP